MWTETKKSEIEFIIELQKGFHTRERKMHFALDNDKSGAS